MTSAVREMLDAHPGDVPGLDVGLVAACLEACSECAQVCTLCADACLAEEMVAELRHCIRTDLECADVCAATARVLARRGAHDSGVLRTLLETCAAACRSCGDECARHADMHDHCRICAEVCRRCEQACRALLDSLA
jgi:hypothetical protein